MKSKLSRLDQLSRMRDLALWNFQMSTMPNPRWFKKYPSGSPTHFYNRWSKIRGLYEKEKKELTKLCRSL